MSKKKKKSTKSKADSVSVANADYAKEQIVLEKVVSYMSAHFEAGCCMFTLSSDEASGFAESVVRSLNAYDSKPSVMLGDKS